MRITYKTIQEFVEEWNDSHSEMKVACFFNLNYACIIKKDNGEPLADGKTPREAWHTFQAWQKGYMMGVTSNPAVSQSTLNCRL